jgi:hypothetical protein
MMHAQPYINYEEKLLPDKIQKDNGLVKNEESEKKMKERTKGKLLHVYPLEYDERNNFVGMHKYRVYGCWNKIF